MIIQFTQQHKALSICDLLEIDNIKWDIYFNLYAHAPHLTYSSDIVIACYLKQFPVRSVKPVPVIQETKVCFT